MLLFKLKAVHFIHKVLCLYLCGEIADKLAHTDTVYCLAFLPYSPMSSVWGIVVLAFLNLIVHNSLDCIPSQTR